MKSRVQQQQEDTREEMEAESDVFVPNDLDKLQNLGINAADINKLKAAGKVYTTLLLNNTLRILHCSFHYHDNKKRSIECQGHN